MTTYDLLSSPSLLYKFTISSYNLMFWVRIQHHSLLSPKISVIDPVAVSDDLICEVEHLAPGKRGHIARVCRKSRTPQHTNTIDDDWDLPISMEPCQVQNGRESQPTGDQEQDVLLRRSNCQRRPPDRLQISWD